MDKTFAIYCDESCHLENDKQKAMVLGAVWCSLQKTKEISFQLRSIKTKYGIKKNFEIKWTKVSPAKIGFYMEVLNYFFKNANLHFRALVVPDKSQLKHSSFNQTHDDFYYKMYYEMLKTIIHEDSKYRIYLDYKDTRGGKKIKILRDVLQNKFSDYSNKIIERIQVVRSHEVELIPLSDFLIGAIAYANRGLSESKAKLALIDRMKKLSGQKLTTTSNLSESKFNIFIWHPQEVS
ncbi:DUF3800 domain-containing protein [bacterium]|nr:DUF3800 domain-containing protein [bacterium]